MKEIVLVHPKEKGKLLGLVARLKSNPCEYECQKSRLKALPSSAAVRVHSKRTSSKAVEAVCRYQSWYSGQASGW